MQPPVPIQWACRPALDGRASFPPPLAERFGSCPSARDLCYGSLRSDNRRIDPFPVVCRPAEPVFKPPDLGFPVSAPLRIPPSVENRSNHIGPMNAHRGPIFARLIACGPIGRAADPRESNRVARAGARTMFAGICGILEGTTFRENRGQTYRPST